LIYPFFTFECCSWTDPDSPVSSSQLDLKQKLEEHTKLQKDNATKHRHWTEKHAELELQYIE
jgi:hypothetical protein